MPPAGGPIPPILLGSDDGGGGMPEGGPDGGTAIRIMRKSRKINTKDKLLKFASLYKYRLYIYYLEEFLMPH